MVCRLPAVLFTASYLKHTILRIDLRRFKKSSFSPGEDGEELYESIYEVIRQPSSESDFEEINEEEEDDLDLREKTSNLSKIAEAAGRKMKKLKTNWSMKKNDITRSLSKIKRTSSRPSQSEGGEGRRKVVRRLSSTGFYSSLFSLTQFWTINHFSYLQFLPRCRIGQRGSEPWP